MIQAPSTGTVHNEEPPFNQDEISFAPELVQFIKDHHKVKTYRLGRKYDYLSVGDEVMIIDTISRVPVGRARVAGKSMTTFLELPLDEPGHQVYRDKDHQRQILDGYYRYTGQPIADKTPFMVLEFELL